MTETVTEEAPYGYKPDGTPYKRNPERYKRAAETRAANSPGRKGARSVPQDVADSRKGVRRAELMKLLTLPTALLAGAGQMRHDVRLVADAMAIHNATPPIADAVADIASQDARIAQFVDSLNSTGPYAALVMATLPLVAQIAANHIPSLAATLGPVLGVKDPTQYVREHQDRQEAAATENDEDGSDE